MRTVLMNSIRLTKDPQTVRDALEELHIRSYIRPSVSNFGRIIIIHSLIEWNWQIQRFYSNKLSQLTPKAARKPPGSICSASSAAPYPASIPQILAWRNNARGCLDVLHWEALGISSKTGGIESPLFLVLHLARLILLTPVSHLRTLAEYRCNHGASGTCEPRTLPNEDVSVVRYWFTYDKYKCRLAVLHAGAIYWHIRRYSSDAILQPFAPFLATLVLWTYATCSSAKASSPQIPPAGLEGGSGPNLHAGSVAGDGNATTTRNHRGWIGADPIPDEMNELSSGSDSDTSDCSNSPPRAPSFMHLDRPFDDELAQHFIRLADTMQASVDRVGDLCTTVPAGVLKEGSRLLREKFRKWDVSKTYATTLEDLMLPNPLS
ncbi:uncharacterized protein N7496_010432 [Penicillium cataractarum]|uniref:Transcription factor domain-containing protein n=1 Tax=Penicillium cataractarum TaxID=2100454 RepID=A0A9W9V1Y1_9EURO|nr:uncharacterized protein N7496_010432 [Penicillium cataractarum]KAJ5364719.1 hypothetical protein N7496_010432 [Penicillium cataractarum]